MSGRWVRRARTMSARMVGVVSGVWLCIVCLFVGAEPGGDGAVIEKPESELGAFPHGGGAVVEVEHGAGGGGEGVALGGGAAAGEDFTEDGGVFRSVAAGEFGERVPGKPEVFGGDGVVSDGAVAEFPYGGGPVDGNFVDAGAVDDEGSFAP